MAGDVRRENAGTKLAANRMTSGVESLSYLQIRERDGPHLLVVAVEGGPSVDHAVDDFRRRTIETTARIRKTTSKILPTHAASPAIPPNPNTAAMMATTKKRMAQRSMTVLIGAG
jgi:hypothetical protein